MNSWIRTSSFSLMGVLALGCVAVAGPDEKKKGKIRITLADGSKPVKQKKGVYISGSSKGAAATSKTKRRPHEVLFSVTSKDVTEVLPIFERQVGVKIAYRGPVGKKVTLRLSQPVPWQDAIELIEMFTKTHMTRDANGRLQLRARYGGKLDAPEAPPKAKKKKGKALQASKKKYVRPKARGVPRVRIGNPRPMRMGAFNNTPRQIGPRRSSRPRRIGPRRRGRARYGPRRPNRPRRRGPRRRGGYGF